MVWRDLELNPGLLNHWRTLCPLGQWAGLKWAGHKISWRCLINEIKYYVPKKFMFSLFLHSNTEIFKAASRSEPNKNKNRHSNEIKVQTILRKREWGTRYNQLDDQVKWKWVFNVLMYNVYPEWVCCTSLVWFLC